MTALKLFTGGTGKMDTAELRKTVCCNLRSVTQSCKGGVPFNRLQTDYKALLGTDIPYRRLGFESLDTFLSSIPAVVRIKIIKGQRLVEGVVDQSTAHIVSMISKQKNSKTGIGLKPPVAKTKSADSFRTVRSRIHSYLQASKSTNGYCIPSNHKIAEVVNKSEAGSSLQNPEEHFTNEYSLPLKSANRVAAGQLSNLEQKLSDKSNVNDDKPNEHDKKSETLSQVDWEDVNSKDNMSNESIPWKKPKKKNRRKKASQIMSNLIDAQKGATNQVNIPSSSQGEATLASNPKMEELAKAVGINLRCVTMSSKDGVLLKNLQKDYRSLIGTPIPFDILGYDSLELFIESIPDVIKLKTNQLGQVIAEAVPDASTAHIFNRIGRQKPAKKSAKMLHQKPRNKKVQKTDSPSTKAPDAQVPMSQQSNEKILQQKTSNTNAQQTPSIKRKSSQVPISQHSNGQVVKSYAASLSGTSQSNSSSREVLNNPCTPRETLNRNDTAAGISTKTDFTSESSNSTRESGTTLESFTSIKRNIARAHFSTLLGLHNLLYGVCYMDILKEKILKFSGLHLVEKEEYKKLEFLLSVLPQDGLKEYLNMLCVAHSDTDERDVLHSKLLNFITFPSTERIDPKKKVSKKMAVSDLYKKLNNTNKQIVKVLLENNNLKAELLKIKNDVEKPLKEKSLQNSSNDNILSLVSNSESKYNIVQQSSEICDLKSQVQTLESQLTAAATKNEQNEKERLQLVSDLNKLKHDKEAQSQSFEKQKMEFMKYIQSVNINLQNKSTGTSAEIKCVQDKISSYENIFNRAREQADTLKNEMDLNPSCQTKITVTLLAQLLGTLNKVLLQS